MEPLTFKHAVCQAFGIQEKDYVRFVLKRSLSNRARLLYPLIRLLSPDFLFNETRLVEQVGNARSLKEIQQEIDFYHHKFVTESISKDALRFRISGIRLMRLAKKSLSTAAP